MPTPGQSHQALLIISLAIFVGVMVVIVSRKLQLPAIVLLLVAGIALGPEGLGRLGFDVFDPSQLGPGLEVIVSLFVGVILFEGGLTLDAAGYRSASGVIKRLLTIGVLVTWGLSSLAVFALCEQSVQNSILAGSLIIVTGPTVISPLLKRIRVSTRLHNILHWESVLIDPIGVFCALLCYELVLRDEGGQIAVLNFAVRVAAGLGVGIAGGVAIAWLMRIRFVPDEMINVFALSGAVAVFGAADAIESQAGLLAVAVAGFLVGVLKPQQLRKVREFKAELTDLLIGTLFMLLAARLKFDQFEAFGWRGALAVAAVMFIVRPANVFASAWRSDLQPRERAFLSWVAPRGIVAASVASLIQLRIPDPQRFIETFTYSVILATVVLQGLSAGALAKWLGVQTVRPTGWLIVGAHALARRVAAFLSRDQATAAIVVDSNSRAVREALGEGLRAIAADARDTSLYDRSELRGVGNVLAITDNEDLNQVLCQRWATVVGAEHVFQYAAAMGERGDQERHEEIGRRIWTRLPRPTLLSAELQRGETMTLISTKLPRDMDERSIALMTLSGTTVTFEPRDLPESKQPAEGTTLYLRRRLEYLPSSLREDLVVVTQATNLKELLEDLVAAAVRVFPSLPREQTVAELLERETAFPTALGSGIAVPHTYARALNDRACVIGLAPRGIDFGAADKTPVTLVFLVISPAGDPEGHLATLAEIARLVSDDQVREQLKLATIGAQVMHIIAEAHAR